MQGIQEFLSGLLLGPFGVTDRMGIPEGFYIKPFSDDTGAVSLLFFPSLETSVLWQMGLVMEPKTFKSHSF